MQILSSIGTACVNIAAAAKMTIQSLGQYAGNVIETITFNIVMFLK